MAITYGGATSWLDENTYQAPAAPTTDTSTKSLLAMIKMRLRTPASSFFENWHAYKLGDVVHVMVVTKHDAVLLKDSWPLFPSDELITKLRLLEA